MAGYQWKSLGAFKPVQELCGYITVDKAADILGVNRSRVLQLIHEQRLVPIPLGERPFFMLERQQVFDLAATQPKTKRGPARGSGGRGKKKEKITAPSPTAQES
jgi:hypothetical protein